MSGATPNEPPEWLVFLNLLNREELRQQVEDKRTKLGLRWSDLAQMAGLSTPYLHQLLNGKKTNPSQKTSEAIRRLVSILHLELNGVPTPAHAVPNVSEAPVLIRRKLAELTDDQRRGLVNRSPQARMAWLLKHLLSLGYAASTLEKELQITHQTLDNLLQLRIAVVPRHVERLCALTGLGDDFVFKGLLETVMTKAWQELHALLDEVREKGVSPETVRAALTSLMATT